MIFKKVFILWKKIEQDFVKKKIEYVFFNILKIILKKYEKRLDQKIRYIQIDNNGINLEFLDRNP